MKALKTMKINETQTVQKWIVKRTENNIWRLGELMGDWITSGTAEQIEERIAK